ncbi:MAG: phosphoribosylamine--glycine ligase [Flammeovirgaceae bacterium TMED32]|nr:MAG: phosphoribosylamine--glycine ligase [Flammeovirgaceae bacterium TMED32]
MKILILGSGGREHALAWKISQSELCEALFVAPGNGGTAEIATNFSLQLNDKSEILDTVVRLGINLLVIGPEDPLVNGVVDFLKKEPKLKDLLIVGPSARGALLEGSKDFAKQFMLKYGIPTAAAEIFTKADLEAGKRFLAGLTPPYVLKADGLAGGKGVIITKDLQEAEESLEKLLAGQFGAASENVLIEEFLDGIELSVFVLTDGEAYVILPEAKDYKRIGEADTGPNTGGMGAVSPVSFADAHFMKKVEDKIIVPTIKGIKSEGFDYHGFVFFGLIKVGEEPMVIEYNVRMGDPETEVVMPRIKSDIVPLLVATARGELSNVTVTFEKNVAATVVLVSAGYPGSYERGERIKIDSIMDENIIPFHAGTVQDDHGLCTQGGRVFAITGWGNHLTEALVKSYKGVESINWRGMNYRKDIGFDLVQ